MKMLLNNIEQKKIIKSNNLIESSYKLSVAEQRLLYLAATKLNARIIENNMSFDEVKKLIETARFELIEISVVDYMKEYNLKRKDMYYALEKIAQQLFERKIIYQTDDGSVIEKRWVITCKYNENNKSVQLQFHPDLIEDLLLLKNKFTILQFEFAKKLKSQYSYRLYELLKQYSNFKKRKFTIDEFRFVLGIGDDEYPKYSNLKSRVIDIAIKEINSFTDIEISVEEIKNKRRVSDIIFKIKPQIPQFVLINKQLSFVEDEICVDVVKETVFQKLKDLLEISITAGQAEIIYLKAFNKLKELQVNKNVFEFIKEKKEVVDSYNNKNDIANYIGTLIKCIDENWENAQVKSKKHKLINYSGQRKYDIEELEKMLLSEYQK